MPDEEDYKTLKTGRITTKATVGTPDSIHKAEHARNVMQGYTLGSLLPSGDRTDVFDIDYSPEKLKMDQPRGSTISDIDLDLEEKPEPEVTRGVRNNNPFNLVYTDDAWEGKVDRDIEIEDIFERFDSPEAGIRAGAINVLTQFSRGYDTLATLLERLTPSETNPTEPYIKYVSDRMNIDPNEKLNLTEPAILRGLSSAIIGFENANHAYGDELLDGALARALEHHITTKNTGGPVTQPLYSDRKYII